MRTYSPKAGETQRQWYVIDAQDVVLGRLAVQAATLLRGKHKPTFAPHVDTGDFVVIVNADKVALTGAKKEQKLAYRHSGYPGGECFRTTGWAVSRSRSSRSTPARRTRTRLSSRCRSTSPRSRSNRRPDVVRRGSTQCQT